MNFLKKIKTILQRPYIGLVALVLFFGVSGIVMAQVAPTDPLPGDDGTVITIDPPTDIDPDGNPGSQGEGTLMGWGWMGTGIANPNSPEGGGGWLKFNCAPEGCDDNSWGVSVDMDENSLSHGYFSGEAWSNNYGWLVFDRATVESCWQANPDETANDVAHILFPSGKVVGWAKFINGDDFNNDGYTGCVSFSGIDYSSTVDLDTGALEGWAWGSNVVGWISFQNPECPFCDPTIVLDDVVDITFWADSYAVPAGGGTTLRWSAQNTSTTTVVSCPTYSNTNNYSHWRSSFFNMSSANVGPINTGEGNLPIGEHPISGINATTTYELTCKDSNGDTLPTKYLTIRIVRPIIGCMDSTATNYNANANVPGRCIYGPGRVPTVDLTVVTNFPPNYVPVNSSVPFNYQASPRWTFTNPTQVGTPYCHGKFFDQNGVEQNLQAWTGADLGRPGATTQPPWFVGPYSSTNNVAAFAPGVPAGSQFTYQIDCTDISGNTFSDTAVIVFRRIAVNGCTDLAANNYNAGATNDDGSCTYDGGGGDSTNLTLNVEPDTFTIGSGNYIAGPTLTPINWTSNDPADITPGSCVGSFEVGSTPTILNGWTGNRANPTVAIPVRTLTDLDVTPAASITTPTTLRFTITCDTVSGGNVSDFDTINMIYPNVEPPILWLHIVDPTISDTSLLTETIAATGEGDFVLNWQAANVVSGSCEKASERYAGAPSYAPLGANTSWPNGGSVPLSSQGYGGQTLDISGPDIRNTKFQIECEPLNAPGTTITAQVCMGVEGVPFPQSACSAGDSTNRPPGYKEI